ncbi:MAG: hypothetical protein KIS66_09705 [Fimbriimonadaceae bacterium]|nr:hypothetical protein [Fimbriimonadaceae bacterium]
MLGFSQGSGLLGVTDDPSAREAVIVRSSDAVLKPGETIIAIKVPGGSYQVVKTWAEVAAFVRGNASPRFVVSVRRVDGAIAEALVSADRASLETAPATDPGRTDSPPVTTTGAPTGGVRFDTGAGATAPVTNLTPVSPAPATPATERPVAPPSGVPERGPAVEVPKAPISLTVGPFWLADTDLRRSQRNQGYVELGFAINATPTRDHEDRLFLAFLGYEGDRDWGKAKVNHWIAGYQHLFGFGQMYLGLGVASVNTEVDYGWTKFWGWNGAAIGRLGAYFNRDKTFGAEILWLQGRSDSVSGGSANLTIRF